MYPYFILHTSYLKIFEQKNKKKLKINFLGACGFRSWRKLHFVLFINLIVLTCAALILWFTTSDTDTHSHTTHTRTHWHIARSRTFQIHGKWRHNFFFVFLSSHYTAQQQLYICRSQTEQWWRWASDHRSTKEKEKRKINVSRNTREPVVNVCSILLLHLFNVYTNTYSNCFSFAICDHCVYVWARAAATTTTTVPNSSTPSMTMTSDNCSLFSLKNFFYFFLFFIVPFDCYCSSNEKRKTKEKNKTKNAKRRDDKNNINFCQKRISTSSHFRIHKTKSIDLENTKYGCWLLDDACALMNVVQIQKHRWSD